MIPLPFYQQQGVWCWHRAATGNVVLSLPSHLAAALHNTAASAPSHMLETKFKSQRKEKDVFLARYTERVFLPHFL